MLEFFHEVLPLILGASAASRMNTGKRQLFLWCPSIFCAVPKHTRTSRHLHHIFRFISNGYRCYVKYAPGQKDGPKTIRRRHLETWDPLSVDPQQSNPLLRVFLGGYRKSTGPVSGRFNDQGHINLVLGRHSLAFYFAVIGIACARDTQQAVTVLGARVTELETSAWRRSKRRRSGRPVRSSTEDIQKCLQGPLNLRQIAAERCTQSDQGRNALVH